MTEATETGQTIETMFLEERRYPPPEDFAAQANAQPEIYERDWQEFWESEARERVTWFEPFTQALEWELPYAKWFGDGKLNVCFSGKIMRRLLRDVAENRALGDTTTVADPAVVEEIKHRAVSEQSKED